MIKNFSLLLLLLIISEPSLCQKDDAELLKTYKLDFAVPDIPAFKMLGSGESSMLRPSTPEALAIMVSEFLTGSNNIIPNSFSAEIAPYILFNYNTLTLQDYDKNAVLYSLRISAGSMNDDEGNASALSFGARLTLIDEGDLKNDKEYRGELFLLTAELINLDSLFEDRFLEENDYLIEEVASDDQKRKEMEEYINEGKKEYEEFIGLTFNERLDLIKEEYKSKNWNKRKWDIAAATLGISDSTNSKIKFAEHSIWSSFGLPVSDWGHLLFGGNLNFISAGNLFTSFNISSRFYGGINRIKGFAEVQFGFDDMNSASKLLTDFGAEINIYDGIWINFFAGVEYFNLKETVSQFISHFDLRFTIPEKFNLF
jgi:hypothetical protein